MVVRGHHNFLLVGTPSATSEMLVAMRPYLRKPLHEYEASTGTAVPQPSEGTLVLSEVARLDLKRQTELLRWFTKSNERLQVQVVSTTSEPIFSTVQTGAFLADLYYRLNVVRIELSGSGERIS